MHNYVLGFCFHPVYQKVVLIKKTKPAWQNGLLNGVGGKIEAGETSIEAMIREFGEETGCWIEGWAQFAELAIVPKFVEGEEEKIGSFIDCFYTVDVPRVKTTTEEPVDWYNLDILGKTEYPHVPNLNWLIPMAVDKIKNPKTFEMARIIYPE